MSQLSQSVYDFVLPVVCNVHSIVIVIVICITTLNRVPSAFCFFRCPPCKTFTPVLKHFYGVCKQNNVEIIFVSSDKSIQSFQEYFGTMPWLALPMTSQSAAYAKNLSSRLSIRSIPQLIVLDQHGNYITNNGQSQVANAAHDIGASLQLIQSWKSAQATHIDKVNFGMVSSIFSKVKEGYNYVTGSGTSGKAERDRKMNCCETGACSTSRQEHANGAATVSSGGSNSIANLELDLVAYTILAFFQEAATRLKKFPNEETQMKLIRPLINVEASSKHSDDYIVPISLEEHRSFLLKEQILALEDTVSRVSEERSTSITSKEVQDHLRALGANQFSGITSNLDVQKELKDHMNVMNEEARTAFARSVLWSEMRWMKQETKMDNGLVDFIETKRPLHKTGDGQEMDRKDLLEFCALCSAVVKLDEVEEHLKSGKDVFASDAEFLIDDRSTAPQRILQLQQTMLCAIGFEPTFGGEELHRIMTTSEGRDEEVEGALASYLMTMQVVAKEAMDGGSMNEGLTDKHEGGVTKIVSVKYSEKTMSRNANGEEIIVGDDAPTHARMEQQSEEQQKMQLKMAAQAASMQQSILDKIILMSEIDRNEQLTKARKAHDLFLRDAMALPPGPQRVEFLQNVSSEQQKLMLIHKLWESRLSE